MRFLKTLFWVVLAVAALAFSINNWTHVTINLWANIVAEVNLPLLLLVAFLLGLLPTFVWHRTVRWRLNRRIDSTERALADVRSIGLIDEPVAAPAPSLPPAPPLGARF